MLDVFRKHAYSKGTKILLGFLIVIFALFFGIPSYLARTKAVATVNCRSFLHFYTLPGCQNITPEQIDAEVSNIRKTLANTYGENAAQMLRGINLRQMALDQLIEQALIEERAQDMGLRISDDDLAHMIESQTAFQVDGRFNVQRYNE